MTTESFLGEASLSCLLACSHMKDKEKDLSLPLLMRPQSSGIRVPPSRPCMHANRFSHVRLHETRGIVAHQASLFMGFSRQGYRSRLPFPTLGNLTHPGKHPSGSVNPQLFNLNWWTGRPGNCDSWGRKESDMTKRLNWTELNLLKTLSPTILTLGVKASTYEYWDDNSAYSTYQKGIWPQHT